MNVSYTEGRVGLDVWVRGRCHAITLYKNTFRDLCEIVSFPKPIEEED